MVSEQYKIVQKCPNFVRFYVNHISLKITLQRIYRNRLTDPHLDGILKVACSSQEHD